ncbi:hypothetical protein J4E81_005653 [Alternaria sp. BMP 2799]|nr:hypothetical protein J4E81_005653 [Alternaria sp. BMP 2799]
MAIRWLHGYETDRDFTKRGYNYMEQKPAYASIKDQRDADMGYRNSDITRPHECSIIDQQSQYWDQQSQYWDQLKASIWGPDESSVVDQQS